MTMQRMFSAADAPGARALSDARERTLSLVEGIDVSDLERVQSPLMSPLVWDMGHIAAFEDLWLAHRQGGLPLLRDDLMDVYDAFETPRAERGELEYLRSVDARKYMADVRARVLESLDGQSETPLAVDLVIRHELQHTETMAQTLCLAHIAQPSLEAFRSSGPNSDGARTPVRASGLDFVSVPDGQCVIGAGTEGFAYDNERPQATVGLPAFEIGRLPVTNGDYREFIADGGYERREWWTAAGWEWRQESGVERPGGWTESLQREWRLDGISELDPYAPVVHVSWFEADAFCRARDGRLPTEFEWEKACAWDRVSAQRMEPSTGAENLGLGAGGTLPVAQQTATPFGCLGMLGDTWEWTSSWFEGYPGFVANPYREYSEVFFGHDYRVLRGGSWATSPLIASASFRNWDYPQRRQIFAGFRVAR
jgi:iron(II)-dependent oxidoreductase